MQLCNKFKIKILQVTINLNFIYIFSPYGAIYTLLLGYTNQSVNTLRTGLLIV